MGLDANYPAVTMNDPQGTVTVYNQDHAPIGHLGPSPYQSPSVNVRCRTKAWGDAYWYRLVNPDGWDFPATAAYVSADEPTNSTQASPTPHPTAPTSAAPAEPARQREPASWRSAR